MLHKKGVLYLPVQCLSIICCVIDTCMSMTGERNTWGSDRLFVGIRHPSYSFLEGLYEGEPTTEVGGSISFRKALFRN